MATVTVKTDGSTWSRTVEDAGRKDEGNAAIAMVDIIEAMDTFRRPAGYSARKHVLSMLEYLEWHDG